MMKKFLCITTLALAAVAVFSCKEQNPDQTVAEAKFSDMAYLTDGLIVEDAAGNISGYVYGAALNEANPYEIFVPVNSYDEAVHIFLKLLPKGAQLTTNGKTLSWPMTDRKANPEGEAVLSPSTAPGEAGTLTIGSSRLSVHFVSVWPENADDIRDYMNAVYPVGTVVSKPDVGGFGEGDYVVVRQWTPQECGIMIQPLGTDYTCESIGDKNSLPSNNFVHQVFLALEAWPGYSEVLGSLDYRYLTRLSREASDGTEWCAVNLKHDGEYWLLSSSATPVRRVLFYCFAPEGDQLKCWSATAVVKFDLDKPVTSVHVPDYGDGENGSWTK